MSCDSMILIPHCTQESKSFIIWPLSQIINPALLCILKWNIIKFNCVSKEKTAHIYNQKEKHHPVKDLNNLLLDWIPQLMSLFTLHLSDIGNISSHFWLFKYLLKQTDRIFCFGNIVKYIEDVVDHHGQILICCLYSNREKTFTTQLMSLSHTRNTGINNEDWFFILKSTFVVCCYKIPVNEHLP